MKTTHNLNNVMHAHDSFFIHCEAYHLFHYYEAYSLFVIMSLPSLSLLRGLLSLPLMCSCFMLYNSNFILLFFANHAFFKYDKLINM